MNTPESPRLSTGIEGLDEILHGGLLPGRAYLVRGEPGAGKTILGLHFLTAGTAQGETALFISLDEIQSEIHKNALKLGLDLQGVEFLDLSPKSELLNEPANYSIFSPAEVDRDPLIQTLTQTIDAVRPQRVFLDNITLFRYLSPDAYQFRRQMLAFLRALMEKGATILFTSENTANLPDDDLQFMCDGILCLHNAIAGERSVHISKFRGSGFQGGVHAMRLTERGIEVFPQLLPGEASHPFHLDIISSGVPELDELLNGGIERGTITILSGPSGVGKTTLGLQFMKEAAGRGERSVIYTFEEEIEVILHRCTAVNIPARIMRERGTLSLVKVEPLQYVPDEFARVVRRDVEEKGTQIIMIDSMAGYQLSMRGQDPRDHIHALCKYLQNMGVAVIVVNETEAITGEFQATERGISYLADNIVFLRYLEIHGELRKAIGVLKKRLSGFERTLRELEITRYGIKVGNPLTQLRGILSGRPEWINPQSREV